MKLETKFKEGLDPTRILHTFFEVQTIMGNVSEHVCDTMITRSITDPSIFWNHAWAHQPLTPRSLSIIEDRMRELNRTPAFYFLNDENHEPIKKFLESHGYKQVFEDSWMFYEDRVPLTQQFSNVRQVQDEEDLAEWIETLDACYQKDDPQNPYGTLGEYLAIAKHTWLRNHENNRVQYFTAYKGEVPVAVLTLFNIHGMGYFANLGSKHEVRGQGFAKLLVRYALYQSMINGNKLNFLTTKKGTYPHEYYKRLGFKTEFTAVMYT